MNDLEDRLRDRLALIDEGAFVPRPDLAAVVRARYQRRRLAVPVGVGALGLCAGVVTVALLPQSRPSQVKLLTQPTAATTPATCGATSGQRDVGRARLLVREIRQFAWPSGAGVVAVTVPANACPLTVILTSATAAPEDVDAARLRWGTDVVLVGRAAAPEVVPSGAATP
jgi:hypothetical protein